MQYDREFFSRPVDLGITKISRRHLLRILATASLGGVLALTAEEGSRHREIKFKPAPGAVKQGPKR